MRPRALAANLLLSAAATALALTVAESLARRVYYPPSSALGHRVPDPILGWRLEPGARFTHTLPEFDVRVAYNSRGWRDVEHALAKPGGVFRIVVLGDSFMEAYSVQIEHCFARRLEARAGVSGAGRFEVVNLGVGGYGTLQEYLAFVEEGVRYEPDLVLLGFGAATDIHNNSLWLESAIEGSDWLKVRSRPFLDPTSPEEWRVSQVDFPGASERYRRALEAAARRPWWRRTALFGLLSRATTAAAPAGWGGRQTPTDRAGDAELARLGIFRCEEPPEIASAWSITERILVRLKQAVRESGARLAVFSVPSLVESYPVASRAALKRIPQADDYCLAASPATGRLGGILARQGILFIDLLPAFREAQRGSPRPRLFRRTDLHWNEEGHALAAAVVHRSLRDHGLLR